MHPLIPKFSVGWELMATPVRTLGCRTPCRHCKANSLPLRRALNRGEVEVRRSLAPLRPDRSNCRIYLSKSLYSAQSSVVRHSKVARRNHQQSFSRASQPTCHSLRRAAWPLAATTAYGGVLVVNALSLARRRHKSVYDNSRKSVYDMTSLACQCMTCLACQCMTSLAFSTIARERRWR